MSPCVAYIYLNGVFCTCLYCAAPRESRLTVLVWSPDSPEGPELCRISKVCTYDIVTDTIEVLIDSTEVMASSVEPSSPIRSVSSWDCKLFPCHSVIHSFGQALPGSDNFTEFPLPCESLAHLWRESSAPGTRSCSQYRFSDYSIYLFNLCKYFSQSI